jgi:uncharacterized protein (DUF58 family)
MKPLEQLRVFQAIQNLYVQLPFYQVLAAIVVVFVLAFFWSFFSIVGWSIIVVLVLGLIVEIILLYRVDSQLIAKRAVSEKLSNGEYHTVTISLEHNYPYPIVATIIDEVPFQFQLRDFDFALELKPNEVATAHYHIRPTKRGLYEFGDIHVFIRTRLGLVARRRTTAHAESLPCYPSFIELQRYQSLVKSQHLAELGIKKIRRIGHAMEFEQIRPYVAGDDFRTINWKATSRRSQLMVNQYEDLRAQEFYFVLDLGRSMKMPFNGLSLLDYSINSAFVLANIAVRKGDRIGFITFADKVDQYLVADNKLKHLHQIANLLYQQQTLFQETDFEALYQFARKVLKRRTLLIVFSNLETQSALERNRVYLRRLARLHFVVFISFVNQPLVESNVDYSQNDIASIYRQGIGQQIEQDKKKFSLELERMGITSLLVTPQALTLQVINQYMAIKAKQQL